LKAFNSKRVRVQLIEADKEDASVIYSRPWNLKTNELTSIFAFKLRDGTIEPYAAPAPIFGLDWLALQKSNNQSLKINMAKYAQIKKGQISDIDFGYEKAIEGFQVRGGKLSHALIFDDTGFLQLFSSPLTSFNA